MRVVAVERDAKDPPVEALLRDDERPDGQLLRWWGGRAWETLMLTDVDALLANDPTYRRLELALPDDWEDGYLEPDGPSVRFVLGDQPKRPDWEAKRWSRRLLAKLKRGRSTSSP